LRVREGDFIETLEALIFDVKGLVHPPNRVIAFIRYIPDERGDRSRNNIRYRKVYSLSERISFLSENFSSYLVYDPIFNMKLNLVSIDRIIRFYKPEERLKEFSERASLNSIESDALQLVNLVSELSGVSPEKFGISGSLLVDLSKASSDIDIIVYGNNNIDLVYEILRQLLSNKNNLIKAYNFDGLKKLYAFRVNDSLSNFEEFIVHERRKMFQGTFKGRDFFFRFVKDWDEIKEKYGDFSYTPMGQAKIEGVIVDDSERLLTPCTYRIDNVRFLEGSNVSSLKEVVSYRGRFCDQARNGERFFASGKLEKVSSNTETYHRLLLGGSRFDSMFVRDI
jgi:predicted nucleotidyltransferase